MKRTLAVMLAVAIGTTTATTARAWWNPHLMTGATVLCDAPGPKRQLASVPSLNGAIALWVDGRIPGFPLLFVQRVDRGGVVRWTANAVNSGAVDNDPRVFSRDPVGAHDSADLMPLGYGGAVVVHERRGAIDLQRFDEYGVALWGAGRRVVASGAPFVKPRLTGCQNGFCVSWIHGTANNSTVLRVMRRTPDGVRAAGAWSLRPNGIRVSAAPGSSEAHNHSLTASGSDGAVALAWTETLSNPRGDALIRHKRAVRNSDGSSRGSSAALRESANRTYSPAGHGAFESAPVMRFGSTDLSVLWMTTGDAAGPTPTPDLSTELISYSF